MFATQPAYNAGRAAHALHSDQLSEMARTLIGKIRNFFRRGFLGVGGLRGGGI